MSSDTSLASVKIFKFDPGRHKKGSYKTFKVPYKGRSVLNVLEHIYNEFDPELAFRFGCEGKHDSRCGACAVEVNGVPALACRKVAEKELVIAPHPKFEVFKDLAIDFNRVKKDAADKRPPVSILIDTDKCTRCADCVSICPVGVYEAEKGRIVASGEVFCCGDTCHQCVTYCQEGAITVEAVNPS